ncbi:MAG: hypothetical protein PWP07_1430 [Epulopiscium sp.]|jgi:response regulator RpfG family c-di-GMP phosphodiesterase|uniref:response regulator n=1 Tax=Defluviitalea raffinosedens TaxID=1450156 RepID=UPI0017707D75|nr:response regulator [Defluviitalea raffinosedens]MBM7685974.1 response regulator RpfG family c-di-GMP phosphodiesterase [Defluviitalea raffinosedens]MBZ4669369.1 Response regulator receiver modulated metal dependent phosphohydrolase [Defluviitaleaceae bacterium]MDK2788204.1 hypothetical protein [Candidatus Epulonipiscium sp.]HHW68189.1 DUF3369 domain-containing protein [Candidatus Epulonipiscium sp.]
MSYLNAEDSEQVSFRNNIPLDALDGKISNIFKENNRLKVYYKVLIVDDERDVHVITDMVLDGLDFGSFGLKLLHAYSEREAKQILLQHDDIAVILLDVVMETEKSGIEIVSFIRDKLKNYDIQIILRTGQPGAALEEEIIRNYEINDYKTKTELTVEKLYTTIFSAIRNYRNIITIKNQKAGLEMILNASKDLFKYRSLQDFFKGILVQFNNLITNTTHSMLINEAYTKEKKGFVISDKGNRLVVYAATGEYERFIGSEVNMLSDIDDEVLALIHQHHDEDFIKLSEDYLLAYHKGITNNRNYFYIHHNNIEVDLNLVKVFLSNVSTALDNFLANKTRIMNQRNLIFALGEIVEKRDLNTSKHTKRVSKIAAEIAKWAKLPDEMIKNIELSTSLHDIGKIAVSDSILNKKDKLTSEEFEIMKKHTEISLELFSILDHELRTIAYNISRHHHEQWNGQGYPDRLKGEDIPIEARIASIADVLDALTHKRPYKEAWSFDDTMDYLEKQKGIQFDPVLIDYVIENKDKIREILSKYNEGDE